MLSPCFVSFWHCPQRQRHNVTTHGRWKCDSNHNQIVVREGFRAAVMVRLCVCVCSLRCRSRCSGAVSPTWHEAPSSISRWPWFINATADFRSFDLKKKRKEMQPFRRWMVNERGTHGDKKQSIAFRKEITLGPATRNKSAIHWFPFRHSGEVS